MRITTIVLGLALAVGACGETVEGPGEEDIRSAIVMDLPMGAEVASVELVASQNEGDQIEPAYRTRSNVELRLTEDYARRVGRADGKQIVKIVLEAGETIKGTVFTRGEPIGDGWSVNIEKREFPDIDARPLSSFNDYVIEGSTEHKEALRAEKAAIRDIATEAEAEAEAMVY